MYQRGKLQRLHCLPQIAAAAAADSAQIKRSKINQQLG